MSKEGKLPHRILHSVSHKLSDKVIIPASYAALVAGIAEVPLTNSSIPNVLSAIGLLALSVTGFASVFAKEDE